MGTKNGFNEIPKTQRGDPLGTDAVIERYDLSFGRTVRDGRLGFARRSKGRKGFRANHGQKHAGGTFTVSEVSCEVGVRVQR